MNECDYISKSRNMGNDLVTLMGGDRLKITAADGSYINLVALDTPGVGLLTTESGTYISELDQRCVDLFGYHLTIEPEYSAVYLGKKPVNKISPTEGSIGFSYHDDRFGRQQIDPTVYGPILDRVLIDLVEGGGDLPLFKHDGYPYVQVKHGSHPVRVYLNDLVSITVLSKCVLRLTPSDKVEDTHCYFGDKYSGEVVSVSRVS